MRRLFKTIKKFKSFEIVIFIIAAIYFPLRNWILFPKMSISKLFWRKYRKGFLFFGISSYNLIKERIITEHHLRTWYLKPNLIKLDQNIDSMMVIKEILFKAITTGVIEDNNYDKIKEAIKNRNKAAWEANISLLDHMTFHFEKIREFVFKMVSDDLGYIRETALLIIEDGNFTINEKYDIYRKLTHDKSITVRNRVLDRFFFILNSNASLKTQSDVDIILKEWLLYENNNEIQTNISSLLSGSLRESTQN